MYPARWFPVSGYTTDRFAADMKVTVPMGYTVLGSGNDSKQTAGDKNHYKFKFERASFPGSIAVVKDQPAKVQARRRHHVAVLPRRRRRNMAQQYGDEIGKIMSYFTGHVRPAALRQPDGGGDRGSGAPNGYAAPGHDLPGAARASADRSTARLLANQMSRQWWEELVSPTTRNHLWLTNGLATYSELLWSEHESGPGALETQIADVMVEALTVDTRAHDPVGPAGRLLAGIVGAHRQQGRERA